MVATFRYWRGFGPSGNRFNHQKVGPGFPRKMITSLSNCLSKNATPFGDFLCQKWGLSGANAQVAMCTQGASGHDDAQNEHLFYWKNRHLHFQPPQKKQWNNDFCKHRNQQWYCHYWEVTRTSLYLMSIYFLSCR